MDKVWKAKWIMDPRFYGLIPINIFHNEMDKVCLQEHREDLKNCHMLLRKEFIVNSEFSCAFIDITADDYYKLYVNGHFIGQGPASSYYFHYNYNRFDISRYLKQGNNVIAVHVYYQGLINRVWNSGDYRQGMIAELFLDNKLFLISDSTWKYKISEAYKTNGTIGYDTQYLENIDSRLMDVKWKDILFDDDMWTNSCENITDDHKLYMQEIPTLDIYEIKPTNIKKLGRGHYLIDFGQEITGQFKMKATGKSGEVIEVRCAEELEKGNFDHIRYHMRCNCNYQEFWTLSGRESDTLDFFDYKAFRYVEVIGDEEAIIPASFEAVVRHFEMDEEVCKFNSSDELLNKVWTICKNGVKYGTQENFVDCPSREKGQYLGDVTVAGHSHIYASGDLRMYKKAILDFARSSFISPGIMAVAPGSLMQEIADYSMQWPMQLLIYYKQSGDIEFLKSMYPVAERILLYFEKYKREDGLLEKVIEKWNLVDWPANLRDGYDFKLCKPVGDGCHNVINAFYCGFVKDINEIRSILGIKYIDEFKGLREAFVKEFYNEETKLFVDSKGSTHSALHSNVLPLLFELAPEESKGSIVELIRQKGFSCGVYIAYFVLKALARVGEFDLIYKMMVSQEEHSWGNMIKEGATTCFEAWGKDQKSNTSLCHPWASAPISILIEDIVGLTPNKPGWQEIRFEPHIPQSLDTLTLEVTVNSGKIKVIYKDGKANIQVPYGIKVKP